MIEDIADFLVCRTGNSNPGEVFKQLRASFVHTVHSAVERDHVAPASIENVVEPGQRLVVLLVLLLEFLELGLQHVKLAECWTFIEGPESSVVLSGRFPLAILSVDNCM